MAHLPQLRIGHGYDLHILVPGRPLILGGVRIPFEKGLLGHSDADCLLHALTDSFLGAAGLPDIGHFFPDTDPRHQGADSLHLMQEAFQAITASGWKIVNLDATLIAQKPKLGPYIPDMKTQIAAALGISVDQINIKAKTNEGVDAVGRQEAIAAHAVCLLTKE